MSAARIDELLEVWRDDALTIAEARELRALVEGDAALRDRFLMAARWDVRLAAHLNTPALSLAERVDAMLAAGARTPHVADAVAARIASRRMTASFRRRRRMVTTGLWWWAAAACLLVGLGLVWRTQVPASVPSSTVIATARGAGGQVERAGTILPLSATVATPLADHDRLVATQEPLTVRFPDGTEIDLIVGGRLVVQAGAVQGAKQLELEDGALLAEVAKQTVGAPLVITTRHARATVLGTLFRLNVAEDGTRLLVAEGRVALARRNGGQALEVADGRTALADAAGGLAFVGLPVPSGQASLATPDRLTPAGGRPFAATSPWNQRIIATPRLDARSPAVARSVAAERNGVAAFHYGIPIYEADATTPARQVACTKAWGRSPFTGYTVRVPAGVVPNRGNGSFLVLDWSARRTWEFWKAAWDGDRITAAWGGQIDLDGNGTERPTPGHSGGSLLAGLIRVHEMRDGRIPHALAFGSCFAEQRGFRFPAYQSDGAHVGDDAIPVGGRIQLDPTLVLDAIPGLTPGERIIARALQEYGAYCVGRSNNIGLLFFAERATDATDGSQCGAVYHANGITDAKDGLPHIPWASLRMLKRWDGQDGGP